MSLTHQPSHPTIARLLLAVALVCALLATQWGLNRHVVEHSGLQAVVVTASADEAPPAHDGPGCLICLEHQAHGAALTSAFNLPAAQTLAIQLPQALPPNTPYLAPERASQRAPPVLS